mmetsp:Transcript_50119/g.116371  ORF Transcript_50119/g.116371 Transcript_50119/m.116371 type:complete len:86 (+) Transcript_50119:388-645(+)
MRWRVGPHSLVRFKKTGDAMSSWERLFWVGDGLCPGFRQVALPSGIAATAHFWHVVVPPAGSALPRTSAPSSERWALPTVAAMPG